MLDRPLPIPAFSDNYIWAFTDAAGTSACVVDPGDADPVLDYLERLGLQLTHILITHHHADHTGGVGALAARYQPVIYGPAGSPFKDSTQSLREGERISVFDAGFEILEVPGHTLDHIAYYCASADSITSPVLFCGDTLFSSGCGRLFEGSPEMMYESLGKLNALPGETRVYCTHEYTRANLRFASAADPENARLRQRVEEVEQMRSADHPSLPSSIALEQAVNPFLRCTDEKLQESVSQHAGKALSDPVAVFANLRQWKDNFQG